jgi:hypothetical protein
MDHESANTAIPMTKSFDCILLWLPRKPRPRASILRQPSIKTVAIDSKPGGTEMRGVLNSYT